MSDFAANDFADIAARMRALKCEAVEAASKTPWWCDVCGKEWDASEVGTCNDGTPACDICTSPCTKSCKRCENGGWEAFALPGGGHRFEVCGDCGNPFGAERP
jgi:hypothetical protein